MKKLSVFALTLLLTAGIANARGGGNGDRGPGGAGGPDGGRGGNAIVANDGTVLVTRVVNDTATNTTSRQLVAISATGATAWTANLGDDRGGRITLSGANVLIVTDNSTDTAAASTITARSTATGTVAWTLNVNGHVGDLTPFAGGTYAVVHVPPATQGAAGTRSLVAISNSGTILWTVAL